jgi:hypothetical protein
MPEVSERVKAKPPRGLTSVATNGTQFNGGQVGLWLFIAGIIIASLYTGYLFWTNLCFNSP